MWATRSTTWPACYALGRYAEAEPLLKRALDINEKALGPDHPSVGSSLSNLAELYRAQARYAEAEPLFKRSLTIREQALGPDHQDVGISVHNLAGLYREQGRYDDAEPLFRRALGINERALGTDHPDVGNSLNNLAVLYEKQGRYAEAEPLYKRSLAIYEQGLGQFPRISVRRSRIWLESIALRVGSPRPSTSSSVPLTSKRRHWGPTIVTWASHSKTTLGPDHPSVGQSLNDLAGPYFEQRRWEAAADYWRRSTRLISAARNVAPTKSARS